MDLTKLGTGILLTATIYAEARGEPHEGRVAVCNVVLNRFRKGMATSIKDVILKPKQFSWTDPRDPNHEAIARMLGTDVDSVWAECREIAALALAWRLPDNTRSADHYLNVELTKKLRKGTLPTWAEEGIAAGNVTKKIGHHTFLNLRG